MYSGLFRDDEEHGEGTLLETSLTLRELGMERFTDGMWHRGQPYGHSVVFEGG